MTKKAIVKTDLFIVEVLGVKVLGIGNYKKGRRNTNPRTIRPPSRTDPNLFPAKSHLFSPLLATYNL